LQYSGAPAVEAAPSALRTRLIDAPLEDARGLNFHVVVHVAALAAQIVLVVTETMPREHDIAAMLLGTHVTRASSCIAEE
jgi:hypothetical protein